MHAATLGESTDRKNGESMAIAVTTTTGIGGDMSRIPGKGNGVEG